MIKLIARNEQDEGEGYIVAQQLTAIFDRLYEAAPKLFETALVMSQYTEDHT